MGEPRRLSLNWPGQGSSAIQNPDGSWSSTLESVRSIRGIADLPPERPGSPLALVLRGQRTQALDASRRLVGQQIKLAYLDAPRLEIDNADAAFRGDSDRRYSDWLVVLEAHLKSLRQVMSDGGVVALHVGDREEPFARLLLHQIFGPHNYVGTLVWQRHYSARQVPNSKELSAAHDFVLLAAKDREAMPPVAWVRPVRGLKNTDNDPRGFWKGGHKGARKPDYPYETYDPPYRWRLMDGELPPGAWRLNPLTGVIWAPALRHAGEYRFTVECSDAAGKAAVREFTVIVEPATDTMDATPQVAEVSWLRGTPRGATRLDIVSTAVLRGFVGQEFSALLEASGGEPYDGVRSPKEGRYWEFPLRNLDAAVRNDSAVFGIKGSSIPWIKKYSEENSVKPENVYSIWSGREPNSPDSGAGYTQDATKHLDQLKADGAIEASLTTAKPETLLARLVDLFTEPGDWVCEVFGQGGDLGAVSLKTDRNCLYLAGASDRDLQLAKVAGVPRMQWVADGRDDHAGDGESYSACLETTSSGFVLEGRVSDAIAAKSPESDLPELVSKAFLVDEFLAGQGYWPLSGNRGLTLDGRGAAVVVEPHEYLTEDLAADELHEAMALGAIRLSIYYFRALEEPAQGPSLQLIRVPFDLAY